MHAGETALDFVALAQGMSVPGRRVTSTWSFCRALVDGVAGQGPSLIEVVL